MTAMRSRWAFAVFILTAVSATAQLVADVPGFHYDNQRTGRTTALGPVEPDVLWSFKAEGSIHSSPVVASDGTVYLAATDGLLYALDAGGQPKWTFRAHDAIYSTPALDDAGNIYFGDLDGWYYSIRPDGSLRWSIAFTEGVERRILASPLVLSSGTSYVAAWNGYLYAVDPAGSIGWRRLIGGMPSSSPVADDEGNVYAATLEGSDLLVIKFSPGSSTPSVPVWTFREPLGVNRNRVVASPVVDASRKRLYVAAPRTSDGVVYTVDLTLGVLLAFPCVLPKGIVSSPALGDDGAVYVGSLDGKFYCLRDFGSGLHTVWSFRTGGYYILGSPSVDGVGNIYIGDSDGTVYALSRDGRELWRTASQSSIVSSPVLADDHLYVTSCDGRLYALASPSKTFYFPQIADGFSSGGGLKTQFLFANSGDDSQVQIQFFDPFVQPLPMYLVSAPYSAFSVPLKHGETVSIETTGFVPLGPRALAVGYARITAGERVNGTAILTHLQSHTASRITYQTSVPATEPAKEFSLFVDRTGGRETGLALVNAGDSEADARLSFYDSSGTALVDRPLSQITGQALLQGQHLARYAVELFPELESGGIERGVLAVQSSSPTAAAALCEYVDDSAGMEGALRSMSTLAVIPSPGGGSSENRVFYFPQVGNGGSTDLRLRTALLFTNTGDEADVMVDFFDSDGKPLSLDLVDLGVRSSVATRVSKGEVFSIRTTGEGHVVSGYARVATKGSVSGTARFSYRQGGITLFETGVPACRPLTDCSVFQSSIANALETGVALVNAGSAPATITFRLYDAAYRLVAVKEMSATEALAPGAHRARYAKEIFADADLDAVPLGIITVQSDQPLAVLSLRHADRPEPFPEDIPRLVILPVIEDRPDK